MTDRSPLFTVFTATYNRAHTLHRVFASLRQQTMRDFEWLVVDDGSTDETADLIARWAAEVDFPVRYVPLPHGGKHLASNRAFVEAQGELFIGLDSDDECNPDALERLAAHWFAIPDDERVDFAGVTGLCATPEGEIVGDRYPHDPTDSDPLEIRYRYNVTGEKWGFNRTEALRRHPLPEIANQPNVPDSLVWNRIARQYRTRYVNEVLRTYYPGDDSITATTSAGVFKRSSAFALRNRVVLEEELGWFRYAPVHFVRTAVNYSRFSFDEGEGFAAQRRGLTDRRARALHALTAPIGGALHLRDCRNAAMATVPPSAPDHASASDPTDPAGSPAPAPAAPQTASPEAPAKATANPATNGASPKKKATQSAKATASKKQPKAAPRPAPAAPATTVPVTADESATSSGA